MGRSSLCVGFTGCGVNAGAGVRTSTLTPSWVIGRGPLEGAGEVVLKGVIAVVLALILGENKASRK